MRLRRTSGYSNRGELQGLGKQPLDCAWAVIENPDLHASLLARCLPVLDLPRIEGTIWEENRLPDPKEIGPLVQGPSYQVEVRYRLDAFQVIAGLQEEGDCTPFC